MPPERRRKACKECRAQKIKCDAEPPAICSRCRKMGLPCVLSANPNVRQTKAQLQQELERLRDHDDPEPKSTPAPVHSPSNGTRRDSILQTPRPRRPSNLSEVAVSTSGANGAGFGVSPSASHSFSLSSDDDRCYSRILNGQEFESRKIRECFSLFFRNYLQLLPIVDPAMSPNEYFDQSPFLFWAIVFIGSRRYSRDPTMLGRLAPQINSLALMSLESRLNPIPTIQGLLLLCLWPIPINTMHKDISHVLCGAALHLAMQIGLHVTGTGQDFARTRLQSDHGQTLFRSRLWMHCVTITHTTSLREGIPPLILTDTPTVNFEDGNVFAQFPEDWKTRRRMHAIMMSSTAAMLRTLRDPQFSNNPNPLSPYISLFDKQFLDIVNECRTRTNSIYLICHRLHNLAYHFLEKPDKPNQSGFLRLYSLACLLINTIMGEDEQREPYGGLVETCPIFVERTVMLAAFSILKIHRSFLVEHIDIDMGESAFFSAILFMRKVSLQNDDIAGRSVTILSQLWTSKRIFQSRNGEIQGLRTRIHSRLSMSVVFDCFWWWREEFRGQPSPYRDDAEHANKQAVKVPAPALPVDPGIAGQGAEVQMVDPLDPLVMLPMDQPFPDYDWAANFDFADFNWTASPAGFEGSIA